MKLITIKARDMVEDFDLYPRVSVDSAHISHIAEAMEAGAKLPPPIVEAKTLRIIDGFHRTRAWKRVHGDDSDIEVEERTYESQAKLIYDAMRLNSSHGRCLTTYDRVHAISRAEKLGLDPSLIAEALNIKLERLNSLTVNRLCKIKNSTATIPLKLPVRHMGGQTLTKMQAETIPRLGGNQQIFYVNQLIMLIDSEMLDVTNEALMDRLRDLFGRMATLLEEKKNGEPEVSEPKKKLNNHQKQDLRYKALLEIVYNAKDWIPISAVESELKSKFPDIFTNSQAMRLQLLDLASDGKLERKGHGAGTFYRHVAVSDKVSVPRDPDAGDY